MINKTKLINNSTKSSYKLINNNSKKLSNRLKNNNKFIRNNTLSKLVGNSSNILINSSNKTIINKRNNNNQNQSSSSNGKNDNKFKLNKSISRLGIRSNNKASNNNKNSSSNNTHIRLNRLNKAMSILGICSRRDADKYIANKSVYVNNKLVEKLGTKVNNGDVITVNGINYTFTHKCKTRVWIYNKPAGLVTTHKDEKGRVTVFDSISDIIGQRVISVGRLDLNSEGLLLLTNSGEFARYAESPNTGWERHYRVRFFGEVNNNIIHELVKLKNNNRFIFSGEVNNNKLNSNKLNQFKNNELQNNTENVNDNITDKIDKPNNILINNNECKIMQLKNNEIHTKHLMSNLSGETNNIDVNKLNKNTEINNNNPTASVDLNTNDINICKTHKLENNEVQNNNSMFSVDVNNNTLDSHKTNQLENNEIQNNLTNTMSLNDDTNKTNLEKVIEIISNGITIDGIHYAPIKITNISNNKGLNKWCTCVLKEGKNREIRKIFNYFGLQVNKLIRIKYGPYELGDLKTGEIKEVEDKIEQ